MDPTNNTRQKRQTIQYSDPGKILDLIMSLTDDTCSELQKRINAYLTPTFTETLKTHMDCLELLTDFDEDVLAIIMPHVPKDNTKTRVLMMPIGGKPFAVIICVVAPRLFRDMVPAVIHECTMFGPIVKVVHDDEYTRRHIKLYISTLRFAWPTLKKAIALEYESTLKVKCQRLLRVAKRLFTEVASLETLLQMAMDQAKRLIGAQHCVVMLIDIDKMELYESRLPQDPSGGVGTERRFPLNLGITGEVIKTGTLINTRNATKHPLFNPSIDCPPDINCKNLLCFPIREQTGIIGVGQLINKIGDPYFDSMDEEMALAFSIHCGICIIHSMVYKRIQETQIRNALVTELVMYHMKVSDDEVARLMNCTGFHQHPHIKSLHFNPRALSLRELPCYALKMFSNLGFDKKFNIKTEKLARFILYVKKGYRDVPYHNWIHAFTVTQWAYAAIVNYKLISRRYFNDLQGLMFLVAALVHDIDHRGTTTTFQERGHTNLAALYSSEGSVMERHHIAQTMCILNTEGCDILASLPRRDFDRAIMLLRDNILATDLTNYFRNLNMNQAIAMDFQIGNKLHFNTLQSLLMNAADLCDQIKDWACVKKTAAAVLTEFFKQGELEKLRGEQPAQSMDKDKCLIPDLEIDFLQSTVIPLFDLLGEIIPNVAPCVDILEAHIEKWEYSKPVFAGVPFTAGMSVLLSPELDNLIELNKIEAARLEEERLEAERLAALKALAEAEEESD